MQMFIICYLLSSRLAENRAGFLLAHSVKLMGNATPRLGVALPIYRMS